MWLLILLPISLSRVAVCWWGLCCGIVTVLFLSIFSWELVVNLEGTNKERIFIIMWYLEIMWGVILVLGVGGIVFALGVGVVDLIAKVRANRADRWMDDYREWYNSFEDEREYYCDVFEDIIENFDEFNNYVDVDGVKVIRGVLSSYVDGVRSSKVVQ